MKQFLDDSKLTSRASGAHDKSVASARDIAAQSVQNPDRLFGWHLAREPQRY